MDPRAQVGSRCACVRRHTPRMVGELHQAALRSQGAAGSFGELKSTTAPTKPPESRCIDLWPCADLSPGSVGYSDKTESDGILTIRLVSTTAAPRARGSASYQAAISREGRSCPALQTARITHNLVSHGKAQGKFVRIFANTNLPYLIRTL